MLEHKCSMRVEGVRSDGGLMEECVLVSFSIESYCRREEGECFDQSPAPMMDVIGNKITMTGLAGGVGRVGGGGWGLRASDWQWVRGWCPSTGLTPIPLHTRLPTCLTHYTKIHSYTTPTASPKYHQLPPNIIY